VDREQLEKNQIPVYFVAVIVAAIGGLLAPDASQALGALVTPAIAVLMYAMFLQIPFLDLRKGLANKRFMTALLTANFVAIPLLVWALTMGLADHPAILVGALLVLLTPCIDYVVVFTHIGKGDSKLTLAATPLLLLLQLVLLPLYLAFMLGNDSAVAISIGPFIEAFVVLIALPLVLAVATAAGAKRSSIVEGWNDAWTWDACTGYGGCVGRCDRLSDFNGGQRHGQAACLLFPSTLVSCSLAPVVGALVARAFKLPASTARSVAFSSSTRNSLVVLPLALALPEEIRGLAAAAVITQTLIELVSELIYIRAIPALVWRKM